MHKRYGFVAGLSLLFSLVVVNAESSDAAAASVASIDHGRYLTKIAGCNDCHTSGYAMQGGAVAEELWLMGDPVGWKGPWGTTYPGNLRIFFSNITEDQWMSLAKSAMYRPPMPWFALRDMNEYDLRSIYRYIHSLGAAGEPVPAYVPPGLQPEGPYVQFPAPPEGAQAEG